MSNVVEFPDEVDRAIDHLVREMEAIDIRQDPDGAERMVNCLTRLEALVSANVNRMHALGYDIKGILE